MNLTCYGPTALGRKGWQKPAFSVVGRAARGIFQPAAALDLGSGRGLP